MPPASLCSLLDAIFIYTMCSPDETSARMVSNLFQSTIGDAKEVIIFHTYFFI